MQTLTHPWLRATDTHTHTRERNQQSVHTHTNVIRHRRTGFSLFASPFILRLLFPPSSIIPHRIFHCPFYTDLHRAFNTHLHTIHSYKRQAKENFLAKLWCERKRQNYAKGKLFTKLMVGVLQLLHTLTLKHTVIHVHTMVAASSSSSSSSSKRTRTKLWNGK